MIILLPSQVGADGGDAALSNWPSSAGTLEHVFGSLLEHLHREGLSPQQTEEIKTLPLIPVANGSRLAPPSQVFFRLPVDLSPFAYEVPAGLASKTSVLRSLGAREEASAQVRDGR